MKRYLVWPTLLLLAACTEESSSDETNVETSEPPTVDQLEVVDTTIVVPSDIYEATLSYPILSAAGGSSSLDSLIYTHLSFFAITQEELPDVKEQIMTTGTGIGELGYEVNYNANGVFDITFHQMYVSARMSYSTTQVTLDLHGEKVIKLIDLIDSSQMKAFLFECNEQLHEIVADAYELVPRENEDVLDFFSGHRVTESNFTDFMILPQGIHVRYDFMFPLYAKDFEPDGMLFFSWSEMVEFLDKNHPVVKRVLPKNV